MIRLLLLLAAVAVCTHCTEGRPVNTPSQRAVDNQALNAPPAATSVAESTSASPAQKAYVDPHSGELAPRPAGRPDPEINALQQSTRHLSAEALKAQPSPVPGGGMMIDLKGHFQKPMKATMGDDETATDRGDP